VAFLFPLFLMKVWKYYIDETKSDVVLIEVKARYKDSRVFYNKEHIGTIESAGEIKKRKLFDCSAGEVSIRVKKNRLEVLLNNKYTISSVNQPTERTSKYRIILWVALSFNLLAFIGVFTVGGLDFIIPRGLAYQFTYQVVLVFLLSISIYFSKKRKAIGGYIPLVLYSLFMVEILFIMYHYCFYTRIDWMTLKEETVFEIRYSIPFIVPFIFKVLVIIYSAKSIKALKELEEMDGVNSDPDVLDDF